MAFKNVLANLQVRDHDEAVAWYERLFGRSPDRRPMDGLVEWQLTPSGGVQVFRNPDAVGGGAVVVGVEDTDAYVADLADRGIRAEAFTVPSGNFRLATVQDPAGNTITIAEDRTESNPRNQ